ncbi:MAG: sensor histidine kinase, partial [Hyphomicrobiales bacterium]
PELQAAGIDLSVDLPPQPVWVLANRLRLEQVLINLLSNSIAAMEGCPRRVLAVSVGAGPGHAIITVRDTGGGLGDQSIEQMKEPFHTTRASGNGMGLGLAISAAIVKEHDGMLRAKNNDDDGAVFTIELPLGDEDAGT